VEAPTRLENPVECPSHRALEGRTCVRLRRRAVKPGSWAPTSTHARGTGVPRSRSSIGTAQARREPVFARGGRRTPVRAGPIPPALPGNVRSQRPVNLDAEPRPRPIPLPAAARPRDPERSYVAPAGGPPDADRNSAAEPDRPASPGARRGAPVGPARPALGGRASPVRSSAGSSSRSSTDGGLGGSRIRGPRPSVQALAHPHRNRTSVRVAGRAAAGRPVRVSDRIWTIRPSHRGTSRTPASNTLLLAWFGRCR
jgi:hypothetical protein